MAKLDNDIKLLKLAQVAQEAYKLAQEVEGFDYVYLSPYGADLHINNEAGEKSSLCFVLSKNSWEPDVAICSVADGVNIQFKVERKTVPARPVEEEELVAVESQVAA